MKFAGSFKSSPDILPQTFEEEQQELLEAILTLEESRGREMFARKLAEANVDVETAKRLLLETPRFH